MGEDIDLDLNTFFMKIQNIIQKYVLTYLCHGQAFKWHSIQVSNYMKRGVHKLQSGCYDNCINNELLNRSKYNILQEQVYVM